MSTFKLILIVLTIITIVLLLITIVMEYNFQKTGRFAFWNPFRRKMSSIDLKKGDDS